MEQFTRSEAIKMLEDCLVVRLSSAYYDNIDRKETISCTIDRMRTKGYIKKSELEELVDEVEKMFYTCDSLYEVASFNLLAKAYKALKASHPEFKK